MRRREAMAERFHEEQHLEADRIAAELAKQASQPTSPIVPPGVCPKCGDHVGRAFREHTAGCNGPSPVSLAEVNALPISEDVKAVIDAAVSSTVPEGMKACPKCGKAVKPKGIHAHTRNCKGLGA